MGILAKINLCPMKNVFATAQGFLGGDVLNFELKTRTTVPP